LFFLGHGFPLRLDPMPMPCHIWLLESPSYSGVLDLFMATWCWKWIYLVIFIYIVITHNMSHTHIYKSCQTSQISSKWCSVQNIMFTGRPVTSRGKRTHPIGCSVDHIQIVKLQTSQKLETSANLIHRLLAMCGYCLLSLLANVH
jgi:hypothetical protein